MEKRTSELDKILKKKNFLIFLNLIIFLFLFSLYEVKIIDSYLLKISDNSLVNTIIIAVSFFSINFAFEFFYTSDSKASLKKYVKTFNLDKIKKSTTKSKLNYTIVSDKFFFTKNKFVLNSGKLFVLSLFYINYFIKFWFCIFPLLLILLSCLIFIYKKYYRKKSSEFNEFVIDFADFSYIDKIKYFWKKISFSKIIFIFFDILSLLFFSFLILSLHIENTVSLLTELMPFFAFFPLVLVVFQNFIYYNKLFFPIYEIEKILEDKN